MTPEIITPETVLSVIRNPKNRSRKLWTASVVLDRMGVYRRFEKQSNYSKKDRIKVTKILAQLCEEGILTVLKEQHTLHSSTWTSEIAYGIAKKGNS